MRLLLSTIVDADRRHRRTLPPHLRSISVLLGIHQRVRDIHLRRRSSPLHRLDTVLSRHLSVRRLRDTLRQAHLSVQHLHDVSFF
jgi:hypothetical protein